MTSADRFCQSCGRPATSQAAAGQLTPGQPTPGQLTPGQPTPRQPSAMQSPPAPPLPYGAVPQGDPFAALGGSRPGPAGTRGGLADGAAARPRGTRRAATIAGVVCGVLLVAGVATTAVALATGGGDDDDVAGTDPSSTPSQTGSSSPTQLKLPPPPSSTPPSKTFVRTPATGDDKNRIEQLADDYTEWSKAIYAGDVGACDYMDLYIVKVTKKMTISCRKSAATPLPSGDKIVIKPGAIKVNGTTGTITFRYNYTFSGKSNHTTSDQPVVKKGGTWFMAQP